MGSIGGLEKRKRVDQNVAAAAPALVGTASLGSQPRPSDPRKGYSLMLSEARRSKERMAKALAKANNLVGTALLRSQPRPLDWWDDFSMRISGMVLNSGWHFMTSDSLKLQFAWGIWPSCAG